MIVGIHHVAVSVPDLAAGLAFYSGLLGFEAVERAEIDGRSRDVDRAIGLDGVEARMAMLRAPNAFIELWEYRQPAPVDRTARPCDLGYPHLALQVRDIEAEYERLLAGGMQFVGEPVDFGTASAIYGRDPFGNVVELYEIRDARTAQL